MESNTDISIDSMISATSWGVIRYVILFISANSQGACSSSYVCRSMPLGGMGSVVVIVAVVVVVGRLPVVVGRVVGFSFSFSTMLMNSSGGRT